MGRRSIVKSSYIVLDFGFEWKIPSIPATPPSIYQAIAHQMNGITNHIRTDSVD